MTMVAYTRGSSRFLNRENGNHHTVNRDVISPKSVTSQAPTAHIPQTGTRETLCGKPMYEQVEVGDDVDIKICMICQRRLNNLMKRLPGCRLLLEIFGGNKLLPSSDNMA